MAKEMRVSCVLTTVTLALQITILETERTPFAIKDVVSQVPLPSGMILSVQTPAELQSTLDIDLVPDLIFDYAYSSAALIPLRAELSGSVVVGMYTHAPLWELCGVMNAQNMAKKASEFIKGLNITRSFLASSAEYTDYALELVSASEGVFAEKVNLHDGLTAEEAELFVGRVLKPAGRIAAVLLVEQSTGALLLPLLAKYHLYMKGHLYLVSDEAAWGYPEEGLLYFTDSAAINATDRVSYEAFVLADRLRQLDSCLLITQNVAKCIESSLALVNIVNGTPRSVDFRSHPIVFPGNSTSIPEVKQPIITVWADLEGLDSDGSIYAPWLSARRGTMLAYDEINRRKDLVPAFEFLNSSVSFGAMKFNKTWALSQIKQALTYPAIAYHSFFLTATVINLYRTFQELELFLPITALSISPVLSDPVRFPYFLRTMSSSATSALIMINFFRVFGWKRVAIVYANSQGDTNFYDTFRILALQHNINIVNSEAKRSIPLDLLKGQSELNETLQDILNTTVRIIIISHPSKNQVAARLYDLGARAGDYMICLTIGLSYNAFAGTDEISRKARQIMRGAMSFGDHYFGGTEGARVKELLIAADGIHFDPTACVNYDSAMLVGHAVDYMLYKGLLFEHGEELIKAMRTTRFRGCMGLVQIENESNDIRPGEFSVVNLHLIGENDTLEIAEAAIYSPTKVQLYTFLPELQFPDGSNSSFPDSWEPDPYCPYLSRDIRDFPPGLYLAMGLSFLVVFTVTIFAILCLWRYRKYQTEMLFHQEILSSRDGFALFQFCVELLQLLSFAPSLELPSILTNALSLFSFNIWGVVYFTPGVFAVVEAIAFSGIMLDLMLFGVRNLQKPEWLRRKWICKRGRSCGKMLIQPLGNILLFPLLSVLLSTFACDKATGPAFSDSFLAVDCWERCWQGRHLRLAIVSAVLLCLYTPLAILSRPLWESIHSTLHIRSSPQGLLTKGIMQLILIASFAILRTEYATLHATVYLITVISYTILLLCIKSYNYERLNMWGRVAMVGVCIYGGLAFFRIYYPYGSILWLHITLYLSYSLLLICGIALQCLVRKYRSLLVRVKEDRYDIIKFAFTFGTAAQRHLQDFNAKRRNSKVSLSSGHNLMDLSRETPHRVPRIVISTE